MSAVSGDRRYKGNNRCPICGGADQFPRGHGERCFGFLSEDGDFAHCSRAEHAGDITASKGQTYGHRLVGPCRCGKQHSEGVPRAKRREVAHYDYIDERGVLLYQVVRYEPKAFAQRRPPVEEGGKWEWKLDGVRRVIYRLTEVIEADPMAVVFVVEGEKDVDNLWGLGIVATCNPQGAGKWHHVEECANRALAGRRVVVISDPNQKGREHAQDVATRLRGAAAGVKVLELPGGLDASDWIATGGTAEILMELALADTPVVDEPIGLVDPTKDFQRDADSGKIYHSQYNIRLALAKLKITVKYNMMSSRVEVDGAGGRGANLDKISSVLLRLKIDESFPGFRLSKDFLGDVLLKEAWAHRYHPVVDYLASLRWDGVERIGRWLSIYGGSIDTEYVRAVGRLVLVAACRRVRQPGCKFDEMLILRGEAGKNKSQALAILAKRKEWFCDDLPLGEDTKKLMEQTMGRWIIECPELDGMGRGNYKQIKGWLSRTEDRSRLAYGEFGEEISRQFVTIATTNEEEIFEDNTGNRKFWPVLINDFDLDAMRRDVDQLWAEAAAAEASGESIRLDSRLWGVAKEEQDAHMIGEPIDVKVAHLLGDLEGKVLTSDIWKVCEHTNKSVTKSEIKKIGSAMKRLGWTKVQLRPSPGQKETYYTKGDVRREITVDGLGHIASANYKKIF